MMEKLAVLGGRAIFEKALDYRTFWPPVDDVTERKLLETYRSRKWTAFDPDEPAFAEAFAIHHGARYGIFTVNGTVTLQCALAACGIGPGDEVIVPPLTWLATALAARHVGARPVFVDILPDTLCIDPAKIEAAITERTKAVIPVHAYGSMADMDAIMAIASRYRLRVIEDCAHMHGGVWAGRGIGTIGDVGSFSFQHTKTMSSGEGGICITNDPQLADKLFRIKQIGYGYGEVPRHVVSGPPAGLLCYNLRATAFHPVILQEQLRTLESRLEGYRNSVRILETRLSTSTKIRFQKPGRRADRQGYFGWVMMLDDPLYADIPVEAIQSAIEAEGVFFFRAEGPIYKSALFNVEPSDYRINQPCTVTENACSRILWLLHAHLGLKDETISKIADAVEKVLGNLDAVRQYSRTGEKSATQR
jgi:L-glutamine:2-deoxy-scyllo-inosose/3-amino-2,3-dideoxy-scyllo-inosose aminotransferase